MGTKIIPRQTPNCGLPQTSREERRARARASAIRLKNAYAAQFTAAGYDRVAESLRNCEETKSLIVCGHCQHTWYSVTRCRLRVCPICSWRVAQERQTFLVALCRKLHQPKLITLTMPAWRSDAAQGIHHLRESFQKLRRHAVFSSVKGGAYSIEVIPHADFFHIHMHVVCDSAFIPYQKLFTAWRSILGITHAEIDIRAASSQEAQRYIAKYAGKSGHGAVGVDMIVKYYQAIKGQRLFATFGSFYNATLEDLLDEEQKFVSHGKCPNCGATDMIFHARDGPFIMGPEAWRIYEDSVIAGKPLVIPLDSPA